MGQSTLPSRASVAAAVRSRVAVDTRALAAFRIGLGTLLLVDLLRRSGNLVAFYTDNGVVPRSALATQAPTFRQISLHALSGSVWLQAALFVVAGVAALALAVGYRTTLATALSFVLLVSLHARNPAILHGGDSLFRQLLLWGIFLPLGERWSVDAADGPSPRDSVASLATAGVLLQVVVVYGTNAVLKLRGEAWPAGEAVAAAFALSRHATWVADLVADVPYATTTATYAWLGLLILAPLLVVLTGWRRALLAGAFAGFHVGMVVFMELGIFPFVALVALVPFLHAGVWDRAPAPPREPLEALARTLPTGVTIGASDRLRPAVRGLVAALLVTMVLVNAVSLGVVTPPGDPPDSVTNKGWDMFAPRPPAEDGYYVVPATLESGATVDALRREPVTWDPPADVSSTFANERWRKLLYQLDETPEADLRDSLVQHLCWRWNRAHDDRMTHVRLVYVVDPVDDGSRTRITYGAYECRS